jgi:hypothetical protein
VPTTTGTRERRWHRRLPAATRQEGGNHVMDDFIKFLMLVAALYGAYHSARTAWRLGTELFG